MIKGDLLQIPKKLLHKFQANEIDEIVITGMGTCHTAAVAIAAIMSNHPAIKESKIRVKAYLASELSAFHIRENMNHTVLIAIAQSGTTMDTNVAVKMVRKQGAYTLAILNKREGDISYLVDTTLYLGNGRDIEIAVPSTKTYVCHILVGYILTCFLGQEINKSGSGDYLALKKLIDLPQQLSAIIENFNSNQLNSYLDKFLQITHWYVVYDSPESYIAGIEARIKLSECCYQSVPLLSVEEFLDAGVNNSVVIFLAGSSRLRAQNFLDKASKCDNYIVLVGNNQVISKAQLPKDSMTKIQYANGLSDLAILPMIINCQLLAYNIALKLDSRQYFFLNLAKDIDSQNGVISRLQEILTIEKNDPRFTGYQEEKLISLRNNISKFLTTSKNKSLDLVKEDLWYLARYSMRPIDTIKHQAKTITVGTQRQKPILANKSSTIFSGIQNKLPFSLNSFNKQRSNKFSKTPNSTICLKGGKVDFKLLKFMVNFLNCSGLNFDNLPNFECGFDYIEGKGSGNNDDIIFLISQKNKGNVNIKKLGIKEEFFLLNNPETQQILSRLESNSCKIDNSAILSLFDGLGACISIMRFLLKSSDNDTLNQYIRMLVEQIIAAFNHSESSEHKAHVKEISKMFKNAKNIKFIGSGENYDAAQYLAALSIKKFKKPFSFDALENHKHIDMSAEALIINLISDILDESYQNDAYSEIEKENAHNNVPIIITNSFDNRFDNMNVEVLKTPCVAKEISLLTYMIHFKKLLF
jgi:glucosamine 6-phosphate synthetase-like amidotransferase/phosphosugar isomerase protein